MSKHLAYCSSKLTSSWHEKKKTLAFWPTIYLVDTTYTYTILAAHFIISSTEESCIFSSEALLIRGYQPSPPGDSVIDSSWMNDNSENGWDESMGHADFPGHCWLTGCETGAGSEIINKSVILWLLLWLILLLVVLIFIFSIQSTSGGSHRSASYFNYKNKSHGFLKFGLKGCMLDMRTSSLVHGEWKGHVMCSTRG